MRDVPTRVVASQQSLDVALTTNLITYYHRGGQDTKKGKDTIQHFEWNVFWAESLKI